MFENFYRDRHKELHKSNSSAWDVEAQAFQDVVDLEFHPYDRTISVNQEALSEWGEQHVKWMRGNIYIAIINTDPADLRVGTIRIARSWLTCGLPRWLIDKKEFDYFHEIPDDEAELIEIFLFCYCGYSKSHLHWHQMPENIKASQLTLKNFQK